MAHHVDRHIARDFFRAPRHLSHRNVEARLQTRRGQFPRFTNIKKHVVSARLPDLRQVEHRNFIVRHHRTCFAKFPFRLNRQMVSPFGAARTFRIAAQRELPEFHGRTIDVQQTPDQRLADPGDQLDRFQGLQRADQARHNPQHPSLRARRHRARFRGARIETSVAWTAKMRGKDRHLSLETPDRAVNIRDTQRHARIVRRIARGKIITPIDHHVPAPR